MEKSVYEKSILLSNTEICFILVINEVVKKKNISQFLKIMNKNNLNIHEYLGPQMLQELQLEKNKHINGVIVGDLNEKKSNEEKKKGDIFSKKSIHHLASNNLCFIVEQSVCVKNEMGRFDNATLSNHNFLFCFFPFLVTCEHQVSVEQIPAA